MIREEFLVLWEMSRYRLAKGIRMSPTAVGEILDGKRGITARTALRLSRFLGCSPEFWMGLQADYDLEEAIRAEAGHPVEIVRHEPSPSHVVAG